MPLKYLRCPNGDTKEVDYCLTQCPQRCITIPTAKRLVRERKWTGTPSTTQLLNGTMMEFLKLTKDYTVDPQKRAFMLSGQGHHELLEGVAKELNLPAEVPLTEEDRDIFDLLEPYGGWTLTDYKLWGSYRVGRALGIMEVGKQPDPSGAKYKVSGKWGKAGDPKMISVFAQVDNCVDLFEPELQLNNYKRILRERGLVVTKMQLQVTVRDGGLAIATARGITSNIYLIPIRELPDSYVSDYFDHKAINLLKALECGSWDIPCDGRESWEGKRCEQYCEVARFCPKGILYQGAK